MFPLRTRYPQSFTAAKPRPQNGTRGEATFPDIKPKKEISSHISVPAESFIRNRRNSGKNISICKQGSSCRYRSVLSAKTAAYTPFPRRYSYRTYTWQAERSEPARQRATPQAARSAEGRTADSDSPLGQPGNRFLCTTSEPSRSAGENFRLPTNGSPPASDDRSPTPSPRSRNRPGPQSAHASRAPHIGAKRQKVRRPVVALDSISAIPAVHPKFPSIWNGGCASKRFG